MRIIFPLAAQSMATCEDDNESMVSFTATNWDRAEDHIHIVIFKDSKSAHFRARVIMGQTRTLMTLLVGPKETAPTAALAKLLEMTATLVTKVLDRDADKRGWGASRFAGGFVNPEICGLNGIHLE